MASDVVGAKEKPYVICSGCVTSRTGGGGKCSIILAGLRDNEIKEQQNCGFRTSLFASRLPGEPVLRQKTDTNTATGAKKVLSVSKEGKTAHHSTCLGSPQLKKKKKKLSPAASCATICMKKGPSKNIFLSFQAISLIPDELQGRGKRYGCGLAGGKGGILWQRLSVRVSMHANMSWSEYICITEKVCLMAAFLIIIISIWHSFLYLLCLGACAYAFGPG